MQVRNLGGWGAQTASPNPLDSRFRGNDGQKIGGDGAIIPVSSDFAPFAPSRLCVKFLVSTRPSHFLAPPRHFRSFPRHSRSFPRLSPLFPPPFPRKRESTGLRTASSLPACPPAFNARQSAMPTCPSGLAGVCEDGAIRLAFGGGGLVFHAGSAPSCPSFIKHTLGSRAIRNPPKDPPTARETVDEPSPSSDFRKFAI